MKKLIIIALFWLFPVLLSAQKTPLNTFFDKYSGQEGYTSIYITKYLFQMFAKISNEKEDKEFKEVTSKLNAIKILSIDSAVNLVKKVDFATELKKILPSPEYADLMVIKEGKKTINFMIKEKNDKISELVMTVSGPGEQVLIFLEGDIDLASMSKLSRTMNIDGFEHLKDVKE
ncbi:MAG: DUF4252 domain-containing protein [Bacteroidales bacterium]